MGASETRLQHHPTRGLPPTRAYEIHDLPYEPSDSVTRGKLPHPFVERNAGVGLDYFFRMTLLYFKEQSLSSPRPHNWALPNNKLLPVRCLLTSLGLTHPGFFALTRLLDAGDCQIHAGEGLRLDVRQPYSIISAAELSKRDNYIIPYQFYSGTSIDNCAPSLDRHSAQSRKVGVSRPSVANHPDQQHSNHEGLGITDQSPLLYHCCGEDASR